MEEEKYSLEEYAMSITIPREALEDEAYNAIAGAMTYKTTGRYNLGDTVTSSQIRSHGRPVEIKPFEVQPDMAMLEDASSPYNVDPETLANLWAVRFGKDWVDAENIGAEDKEDIWWRHAANRLRELGYLEMHTLASSYRVVLRIVE